MDGLQKSRFSSHKMIIKVANEEPEIIKTIPVFARGIVDLEECVTDIDTRIVFQNRDLKGITDDKNDDLKLCRQLLYENSSALKTYANNNNNKVLLALVNKPKTFINRLDQQDLITTSRAVIVELRKVPEADLAEFGLSKAEIDNFELVTNSLDSKKDSRKSAIIEQKSDNNQIDALFDKAQKIKTEVLDNLAPQFERKYPAFYQKYKDAATVHYKHYGKKGNTDNSTDTPTDTPKTE